MKKFYKRLLLITFCLFSVTVSVQAQEPLQEVVHYIRGGNVTGMAKYLDKIVTITISNNQASYSASQAEIILKDFFSKNAVKEFNVAQGGNTGTSSQYAIGDLHTSTGDYQLYVVIKLNDDKFLIREMRFERQEAAPR